MVFTSALIVGVLCSYETLAHSQNGIGREKVPTSVYIKLKILTDYIKTMTYAFRNVAYNMCTGIYFINVY
jgi:hypothetical protein